MKLANKYLDRPISLPDYCDPKRMALRLKQLSLSVDQAFDLLDWAYLGKKDSALGAEMRQSYGAEACYSEWEKRLQPIQVGTAAFARVLTDYLNMGFDLERLCRCYAVWMRDDKDERRAFIQAILEIGLCNENRNIAFAGAAIDPDREKPYGNMILE